jgi:hypothetical protein
MALRRQISEAISKVWEERRQKAIKAEGLV